MTEERDPKRVFDIGLMIRVLATIAFVAVLALGLRILPADESRQCVQEAEKALKEEERLEAVRTKEHAIQLASLERQQNLLKLSIRYDTEIQSLCSEHRAASLKIRREQEITGSVFNVTSAKSELGIALSCPTEKDCSKIDPLTLPEVCRKVGS